jgi:hypothetical protein
MAEVGVQDPARARAFFIPSFQPPLEREEDGWAARPEISGNRGAFGAYEGTARCKEIKRLRVKKLVLGEATDAETEVVVADVREEVVAVGRAAERGADAPRPAAQQPGTPPSVRFTTTRALTLQPSSTIFRSSVIAGMPFIQAPFPNVAV